MSKPSALVPLNRNWTRKEKGRGRKRGREEGEGKGNRTLEHSTLWKNRRKHLELVEKSSNRQNDSKKEKIRSRTDHKWWKKKDACETEPYLSVDWRYFTCLSSRSHCLLPSQTRSISRPEVFPYSDICEVIACDESVREPKGKCSLLSQEMDYSWAERRRRRGVKRRECALARKNHPALWPNG